jgi:hypothetical protein
MTNDVFFTTIVPLVVPFAVAILLAGCERAGIVWAKVNQPTIAALFGGVLGGLYRIEPVYVALNGTKPEGTLAAFIVGGIMVGFAGSGIKSFAKDVSSGAISATSEADIRKMRENASVNEPRIGS